MPRISAERHDRQRRTILDSAIEAFAERGYGLASVDEICRRAGLSKGAIYTYFASKEELFVAASQEAFERRYASLAAEPVADRPADEQLRVLVERLGAYVAVEERAFLRLWVEGYLQSSRLPALEELKTSYRRRFGQLLEDVIGAAQAKGELDRRLDPRAAAETVMAVADGLMLHSLVPTWHVDRQRVLAGLHQLVAHAVGAALPE